MKIQLVILLGVLLLVMLSSVQGGEYVEVPTFEDFPANEYDITPDENLSQYTVPESVRNTIQINYYLAQIANALWLILGVLLWNLVYSNIRAAFSPSS